MVGQSSDGTVHVLARAPGRVNLIGEHTDYTGGLCFPIAIDMAIEIEGRRDPARRDVRLTTSGEADAVVDLDVDDPSKVDPEWARYVAGVVSVVRPKDGFTGSVTSTLSAGSGLSSSAALEVGCALAFGAGTADPVALARLCQSAEHAARGVPTGLLDQLASICGVAGSGLLLDCRDLTVTPVQLPPEDAAVWLVVWAGARSLADSGYSRRVEELSQAELIVGPLRDAKATDTEELDDVTIRARARHVITENERVSDFATSISAGDLVAAGELMDASHASLSGDFDCSTPAIDDLCRTLRSMPGVHGARITGGGWGGCVVALADPGAVDTAAFASAWLVRASAGASLSISAGS